MFLIPKRESHGSRRHGTAKRKHKAKDRGKDRKEALSSSSSMREHDPLVSSYTHLKEKPREAEALTSLKKIASLVKPLMRQRGWQVGNLTEFYPTERNLLGMNWNRGQQICLRLRYPSDERQFLPLEQVVDTMLHELSHNVHDAHDAKFHALWQQLREEHEQLTRKGYTGEGFLSNGRQLGGRRIPRDEARRQARVAAEKRRERETGSGQRLGGARAGPDSDIRQVIADAVQRRQNITKGCASGTKESGKIAEQATQKGFKTKAEDDDANDVAIVQAYIDLLQEDEQEKYGDSYSPPSAENPVGSGSKPPCAPPESSPESSDQAESPDLVELEARLVDNWKCPMCTLNNPSTYLCCDACATERPMEAGSVDRPKSTRQEIPRKAKTDPTMIKPKVQDDWVCHRCGSFMEGQWWTCSACGTMKLKS